MKYTPDSWVPVLIRSKKHGSVYKILCSWYGGFAGADYWKLSSGIESVMIEGSSPTDFGTLTMPQTSGSTYVVSGQTHMSSLMASIYADFVQKAENSQGTENEFTIEIVELEDLFISFCSQ